MVALVGDDNGKGNDRLMKFRGSFDKQLIVTVETCGNKNIETNNQ